MVDCSGVGLIGSKEFCSSPSDELLIHEIVGPVVSCQWIWVIAFEYCCELQGCKLFDISFALTADGAFVDFGSCKGWPNPIVSSYLWYVNCILDVNQCSLPQCFKVIVQTCSWMDYKHLPSQSMIVRMISVISSTPILHFRPVSLLFLSHDVQAAREFLGFICRVLIWFQYNLLPVIPWWNSSECLNFILCLCVSASSPRRQHGTIKSLHWLGDHLVQ